MVRLAIEGRGAQTLRKQDIARREDISSDYVAQLLVTLKNAGLVRSQRGAQGGFALACDPGTITVARIVEAVEGPIRIVPCVANPRECGRATECVTRGLWVRANQAIRDMFSEVRLKDLADQATDVSRNGAASFEI
jgi:Rrf2 family transcriptional regulator, cysteine metabolism repressor